MAGVTQRVKAVYAQHPRQLEANVNEYLANMGDVLDGIKFDHGTTIYEGGEKLTLYTAYILYHPQPQQPPVAPYWEARK